MKKFAIATLLLCLGVFFLAFIRKATNEQKGQGIQFFTGTWDEALAKAKREKKLIFLDAYASWCGPCKAMKRKTFTDKRVGDFYNKYYVSIAVDMEEGEGPMLARKFKVDSYPSLIFLQPDGKFIGKATGFHSADEFLKIMKQFVGK